jgi:hypothetical protein
MENHRFLDMPSARFFWYEPQLPLRLARYLLVTKNKGSIMETAETADLGLSASLHDTGHDTRHDTIQVVVTGIN